MTDQLTLRLEPPLPKLPAGLRPMLARPLPEPFDSAEHLFEPMWGGARALALIGPSEVAGAGEVLLVAEDGTTGPAPVELAGLAARVSARAAVLDGEIVVVDEAGRLDRGELARRFAGEPGRPLSYLAFDLLHLDGRSLLNLALEKRRALLRQVLRPGDEVVAVPAIAEEGRALFEAVAGQGLLGIRARQRASPYLPGIRSRMWRSIAVEGSRGATGAVDGGLDGAGAPGPDARGAAEPRGPLAVTGLHGTTNAFGEPGERQERVLALIRRLPLEFDEPAAD